MMILFYRICFLCRDADSKSFVEAKYNPRECKNEDVQKRAREMTTIAAEAKRVSDILADAPSSFCGTLDYHVKRRGIPMKRWKNAPASVPRMIQDYRNKKDAKPTLQSVLALCIGLNLHPSFSYDLITKAGYNIMIASGGVSHLSVLDRTPSHGKHLYVECKAARCRNFTTIT